MTSETPPGFERDSDAEIEEPSTPHVTASTPSSMIDSGLTQTGMVLGTSLYMAPEMLAGARSAKPASDVFSLGVLAFELLTGVRPFGDLPTCAVIASKDGTAMPLVHERAPEVPLVIAQLVDRCLARSSSKRPTASEIASALGLGGMTRAMRDWATGCRPTSRRRPTC